MLKGQSHTLAAVAVAAAALCGCGGGGSSGESATASATATLQRIAVTPVSPTLQQGQSQQFTATGIYSNGSQQDVTHQVLWSSSATQVATISSTAPDQGLATSHEAGSATISAVMQSVTGTSLLRVTSATLSSLEVAPASPTATKGATQQFTATAVYSDGARQDVTTRVSWSSSDGGIATISNTAPDQGLATTHAVGTALIGAALESRQASATLNVTAAALTSIRIAPATASIHAGQTQQFTATGTFADGSSGDVTGQLGWRSSNIGVADFDSPASRGLATGKGPGTSVVTASDAQTGLNDTAGLTVVPACVIPAAPANLKATPGPGATQATIAWSAVSNASRYVIYRDGQKFAELGNMQAFGDTGVSGSHSYRVSALSNDCASEGPMSDAVSGTALPGTLVTAPVREGAGEAVATSTYPVLDSLGHPVGTRSWRTIKGLGNCCETYVMADPTGRIHEYGGSELHYSDDDGRTWSTVSNVLPTVSAEGAVVDAPGGDVLAVNWDPYGGDQLWTHKYFAPTRTWYTSRTPLHQPFYDRPWISVVQGPFEIGGVTVPYISFVISNFNGGPRLMSLDGLTYQALSPQVLAATAGLVNLDLPADPGRDWTQSMHESGLFPLYNGYGLDVRGMGRCTSSVLTPPVTWNCVDWGSIANPPVEAGDAVRIDSSGAIHVTQASGDTIRHRVSIDGGRHWKAIEASLPGMHVIENWDVQVNAALDQVIVVVHAGGTPPVIDQDMVFRFTDIHGSIRLKEILLVGNGDHAFDSGALASGSRFDFTTVTLLPSGRVALSFGDSKYTDGPGVAIELQ